MSLNWNVTKIEDQSIIRAQDGTLTGLAQTVIFLMMFTDMHELSTKTIDEAVWRFTFYEDAFGALRKTEKGEIPLRGQEIRAFIGLSTNVKQLTRKAWATKIGKRMFEDAERSFAASRSKR